MRLSFALGSLACLFTLSCSGASVDSFGAPAVDAGGGNSPTGVGTVSPGASNVGADAGAGTSSPTPADHDASTTTAAPDAAARPVGDGSVSVSPPDATASTATDATTADATAVDATPAAPDALGPPRQIDCGGLKCDPRTQFCCAQANGIDSCQATVNACNALGGSQRVCADADDCPTGSVCCYDFSSSPASASCRTTDCNGGGGLRVQACGNQAECTTGTCAVHQCLTGGAIESCAAAPPACP